MRFQYSLLAFLAMVLVCAVGLGIWRWLTPEPQEPFGVIHVQRSIQSSKRYVTYGVSFRDGSSAEAYYDEEPFGDIDKAEVTFRKPETQAITTMTFASFGSVSGRVKPIPPAVQARFERIRDHVASRVDLETIPWPNPSPLTSGDSAPRERTIDLRRDFPKPIWVQDRDGSEGLNP